MEFMVGFIQTISPVETEEFHCRYIVGEGKRVLVCERVTKIV